MDKSQASISLLNIRNTDIHIHDGMECIFVISGHIDIEIDKKTFNMQQDQIIVVNPNQIHVVHGNDSNLVLSLFVDRSYLLNECNQLADYDIRCNSADPSFSNAQRYFELKRALIRLKILEIEKEYGYELNFHILTLRVLYILFVHFRDLKKSNQSAVELRDRPDLSDVLAYMHKNYYKHIRLKEMADYVFMSPDYFSRYFKKKLGTGFLQYLQQIRMENAIKNLLYGNDSISKIALDNGFSNQKSFTEFFFKQYNETPGSYRKRCVVTEKGVSITRLPVEEEAAVNADVLELMRYVKKYNIYSDHAEASKVTHSVNLKYKMPKSFKPVNNILNIDRIDVALRSNFMDNIIDIYDLGIKYVYFRFPLENIDIIINRKQLFFFCYDIVHAIRVMRSKGLIPIYKINVEDLLLSYGSPQKRREFCKGMGALLQLLNNYFPTIYKESWMFEVVLENVPQDVALSFYEDIYITVKKILPFSFVGMSSISDLLESNVNIFYNIFDYAVKNNKKPDFVTFNVFPNNLKTNYLPDIEYYPIQGYHKEIARKVKSICEKLRCDEMPLYMMNWNTLTGSTMAELNVYFRSALIAEAFWEVNEYISGAGLWFDTAVSTFSSGEEHATSLALYSHGNVKRPVYYVVEALVRAGNRILFEGKHMVVTRNDDDEFIIFVWNPSFLNPSYCLLESCADSTFSRVTIEIKGFEKANYQFKKIDIDLDTCSSLNHLDKSGYPDWDDKDVIKSSRSTGGNNLVIFEEKITNGTYVVESNINFNGILIYIIKRIE